MPKHDGPTTPLHVIQRRLESLSEGTAPDDWTAGLSKSTVLVLEKSIAAARDSTKVMQAAAKHDLVGESPATAPEPS